MFSFVNMIFLFHLTFNSIFVYPLYIYRIEVFSYMELRCINRNDTDPEVMRTREASSLDENEYLKRDEMRLAIQNWETLWYPLLYFILYVILTLKFEIYVASISFILMLVRARAISFKLCTCFAYLVHVCLVRYLTYCYYFTLFSLLVCIVNNCAHSVGGSS